MTEVGIIGAGITGLTAGYALRKAGVSATLYEASHRVGGVIRSHREGPWLAEGGPNTILETSPKIRELVEETGLEARRMYSRPEAGARYVVRGGKPVRLPGSGPAFFRSPLFSWRAKLRLLREPFIGRADGREESVAQFVRRRLGQEFLDYAIDPLVTGIYAGDPDRLSIRQAFPRIHALEARYGSLLRGQIFGAGERRRRGEVSKAHAKKFSFDDGLELLPATLGSVHGEAVRLRTAIEEVRRGREGWCLSGRNDQGPFESGHRAVLFCGTAHSLARLRVDAPGVPSFEGLGRIDYPPVTSVVLGFRRAAVEHPCEGFGMLIPHREGFGILGTIFSSSLFAGRAPDGHLTLTTYVGGVRHRDVAGLADEPLVNLVVGDLARLLGVRGPPVFRHITRWLRAIPQYEVGYGEHRQRLDQFEANAPGMFVAGHFRDGVALSDSLMAGMRAAERIHSFLKAPAASPCV
jgi:oxygen-dependent protoporphyrinogen oxidase